MSEHSKDRKINKGNKQPSRLGALMTASGNSKSQIPALVPPVLREVGKLAASVAAVSTSNTSSCSGSATGNPRNKVALQPGHSLMDWIRLGTSGKDLTGLGRKAGTLAVTKQELSKHNAKHDAWIAIRGRVYNITEYFPFHPGGEEELIKGAGIDATKLFEQVHPWVNYEQILQKCLVGRLVNIDPNVDTESLFFGEKKSPSSQSTISNTGLEGSSANSLATSVQNANEAVDQPVNLPRFDWIQKLDYITVIFYTKAFSNPLVEINYPTDQQDVSISLTYQNTVFRNELVFNDKIEWPCDVNVAVESGKVEFVFRKSVSGIWENYGVLRQHTASRNSISWEQIKAKYILKKKMEVNYNTWLLKFERHDRRKIIVPIGKHIRAFGIVNDKELSRIYTPVPESLFEQFVPHATTTNNVCLMIKRYPDGSMSRFITGKQLEEQVQFSKPFGNFDLKDVEKRESFLLLAAGTGITPMLGLIAFLLERRIKKCQFLRLLFFNTTEEDILFRNQLEDLAKLDKRFKVDNILSNAPSCWTGYQGYVNSDLIEGSLQDHLRDTGYTIKDIFCFVCGPPIFSEMTLQELKKINISKDQLYLFEG